MQDLIDRRLRGLELRFCPYPPEQLPQRSNRYTYFEVDQDDAYWKLIDQGGNIQLFCPELAGQEARIKLVKTLSER
jgi:predicted component of type VI protein secretion system